MMKKQGQMNYRIKRYVDINSGEDAYLIISAEMNIHFYAVRCTTMEATM